jgi:hypothetical protein
MARTTPVSTGTKEHYSDDMPVRQLDSIGDDLDDVHDEIIVSSEEIARKEYLAELAFMEEPVTILIHKGREQYAPKVLDFYCQGKPLWVIVDTPTVVKRKYLEIIARAQPMSIRTESGKEDTDRGAFNKIHSQLSKIKTLEGTHG